MAVGWAWGKKPHADKVEHQDFSQKESDGGAGVGVGTGFAAGHFPRASFPLPPCPY